jgi:hypothetical protein
LGRKVVLIAPPPTAPFNVRLCLDRKNSGKLMFGPFSQCVVTLEAHHRANASVLSALRRLPGEVGLNVVSLEDILCRQGTCETQSDGISIYVDGHHLSRRGSVIVADRVQLLAQVRALAR